MDIAESPISRTGNREWDDTFNKCFYENMSTVVWPHSCMFEGAPEETAYFEELWETVVEVKGYTE